MKLSLLLGVILTVTASTIAVNFEIKNHLGRTIWIGIQGNSGKPALNNGGFVLNANQVITISSPDNWAGRFWARTYCNDNTKHCETGDCGNKLQCNGNGGTPPVTLAEITLRGDGGKDFYDISLVDGFNVKAQIEPVGGRGDCRAVKCVQQINDVCPDVLKVKKQGNPSETIACKSSCLQFNTDEYCCRGNHNKPATCKPDNWAVNSARVFKQHCPDAYSYAYDDKTSTFTCIANKYIITFG